jgi:nitrous oxidase accessory protein
MLLAIGLLSLLILLSIVCMHFSVVANAAASFHVYSGDSIQQVINSAQNEDVIFVHGGTYPEMLVINKTVSLIGINNPLIEGNCAGSVVTINALNVVFNGFTVERTIDGGNWDNGVSITGISKGCNVSKNKISNNHYGIYVNFSSNNYVHENDIIENTVGIGIENSSSNTVSANHVNYTDGGGICLSGSSNNTISFNKLEHNHGCGIGLFFSSSNTIFRNNLTSFGDIGILLTLSPDNNVSSNNIEDRLNDYGIKLQCSSNNNSISGNYINKNQYGIYVESSNNSISANKMTNNSFGVILNFPNNTLTANNFTNNEVGIGICSSNNTLYQNNFVSNTAQAYFYELSDSNSWDNGYFLGGNYWDDYVGTDAHGDGIGDILYTLNENNVDHYPLMTPYGTSPSPTPTPAPKPTNTSTASPQPSPSPASTPTASPSPEPDLTSEIPEFPSLIILPILIAATIALSSVYFKKRDLKTGCKS